MARKRLVNIPSCKRQTDVIYLGQAQRTRSSVPAPFSRENTQWRDVTVVSPTYPAIRSTVDSGITSTDAVRLRKAGHELKPMLMI